MRTDDPTAAPTASWAQLERAVEQIHAAAREPIDAGEFYQRLLAVAISSLAATGAAAWRTRAGGSPELVCRSGDEGLHPVESRQARLELISQAFSQGEPLIHAAENERRDRIDQLAPNSDLDCLVYPVPQPGTPAAASGSAAMAAVIELWLPAANPLVQQGWLDFAGTLADVASDFHALDDLRRLRAGATLRDQAIELLRRVQTPRTLVGAAFETANEGRRLLDCDRVSVVLRRGRRWRLLCASGVDRAALRTDFTRRTERLADQVARWGEPLSYPAPQADGAELPPRLCAAIEEHVDHSQARSVACAPIAFAPRDEVGESGGRSHRKRNIAFDVVLVAEQFDAPQATIDGAWHQRLVELGALCGPALARTAQLDRFPMRQLLRWTAWMGILRRPVALLRVLLVLGTIAAAIAALVLVPYNFDVEAPATLAAAIERDVFASATGAVAEVRVTHGQQVKEGEVLTVLDDPELALKLQQVRGEIEATRQRLASLAVSRTGRTLRENEADDRLPLSAEQPQLEERLASLELQRNLLEKRRDDLTIRSPHAGQVLTRDVQTLLESRPVERGQVLLTVADSTSGWELTADVPQRDIGHVLEAQREQGKELSVSYRLAGDVERSYPGRILAINASAALDAEGLQGESAPVKVRIALEGDPPPAARPGMTASVRIHCGQQPLGYVWLHDVGATLYRWATF